MERAASLLIEDPTEGVRVLTIANEAKRNAVAPALLDELRLAFEAAEEEGVRCIVLTGAGEKAFCSGYDLNALEQASGVFLPDDVLQQTLLAMERTGPPIIAALNGLAYGAGAELAATCDVRIAGEHVRIAMPPAKLGIVYAPAGIQRFVELIGLSQAKALFYTGDPVEAARALQIGLVDQVVKKGEALEVALGLAERIAHNAPLAVQGMKRAFTLMRRREVPEAAREEMLALRRASFTSEDAKEGIRAVLEKRPPRFRGS